MKTTSEIIDETLATGYTKANRGVGWDGTCRYIEPIKGVCCAVGRCCEAPSEDWWGSWTYLRLHKDADVLRPDEREALLKPEYRGHSAFFWLDLQGLHDDSDNWTETGLSEEGEELVKKLREKWAQ